MNTVSVVIPSYNRGHCLADSVASALGQTVRPLEIIVVDDGSTDDTAAVCARFAPPVRCIRKANGGVSSARNVGLAEARGGFVALLDADDVWLAEKLEMQLAALAACPEAGWSTTDHLTADAAGQPLPGRQGFARDFPAFDDVGLSPPDYFARALRRLEIDAAGGRHTVYAGDVYRLLFGGNFVFPSCALLRRELTARVGPWDEALRVANDTEWFHRVAAVAPAAIVMRPLMIWRRGQQNTLMSGHNVVTLVRNAIISLDRALVLRGSPDGELKRAHATSRRRLLLRLAYGQLSMLDRVGARASIREAWRWGVRGPRAAAIALLSILPSAALRALRAAKRSLR
jgi:glycosyltransferase involved in cell wall biosynthesis